MRTQHLVLAVLIAACDFEPGQLTIRDAPDNAIDARPLDARPLDAPGADARSCAPAPPNCTLFTCSSTSSCYYACGDGVQKATWPGAKGICEGATFQGCILTINSMDEQNCVALATLPTVSNPIWFGYRQDASPMEPAGDWQWECGPSSYVGLGWAGVSGQPDNNGGNANCAALSFLASWIDADCTGTARYICEVP